MAPPAAEGPVGTAEPAEGPVGTAEPAEPTTEVQVNGSNSEKQSPPPDTLDESTLGFDTLALHAGFKHDSATNAVAVPIYQTTSYQFNSSDHAADLFGLRASGNIYTRIMNPTSAVFEHRLAALEGGVSALATASGHFAQFLAITTIANAGDEIVSASALYGGTYTQFSHSLRRLGIKVHLVTTNKPDDFEAAFNDKTRAVFLETVGNPSLEIPDFEGITAVAHKYNIPVIVDNTTATPYLFRPFDHGVDITVHSTTKWIGGHGLSIGGAIVDGGRFPWSKSNRHPNLTQPEPSYHGAVFTDVVGDKLAFIIRARVVGLRDLGGSAAPFNVFLNIVGLETLSLRLQKHVDNALAVAKHLKKHAGVSWVNYPGLPDHPSHERAKKYLPKGAASIVGFGIKGGLEAGKAFIDALQLFKHVANLGDAKSLAIHPASTTHSQLGSEEQKDTGVTPDFVRLSIGIEDVKDILRDVDQALLAAAKVVLTK